MQLLNFYSLSFIKNNITWYIDNFWGYKIFSRGDIYEKENIL